MPIITRLVQGKQNPNRVNLYLDGQFAFSLAIDEVVKQNLKKGVVLTDERVSKLKESDVTEHIYSKLLNFLSYRPRSIQEVRDRLYRYDVKETAKQNILINRLIGKGYLDDLAFARWFIESRNTHRPRSPRRLSQELMAKGVSRETVASVISEAADERETIKRLLEKKLGVSRQLSGEERQKISMYLARQGFAWDKITEVVKSWESE